MFAPGFLAGKKTYILAICSLVAVWGAYATGVSIDGHAPLTAAAGVQDSVAVLIAMALRSGMNTTSTPPSN